MRLSGWHADLGFLGCGDGRGGEGPGVGAAAWCYCSGRAKTALFIWN